MKPNRLGAALMLLYGASAMNTFSEYDTESSYRSERPKSHKVNPNIKETNAYYESKGLRKFMYGNGFVWALNQKNADRKARKENLI